MAKPPKKAEPPKPPRTAKEASRRQAGRPNLMRGGPGPRKQGKKDSNPRWKGKRRANFLEIFKTVLERRGTDIEKDIERLLVGARTKADAAVVFAYRKLAAEYVDGKPAQRLILETPQPLTIRMDDEEEQDVPPPPEPTEA